MEKYALIVVDMIKDNLKDETRPGIGQQAAVIIPRLQLLLSEARRRGWTVIYACDSSCPRISSSASLRHTLRTTLPVLRRLGVRTAASCFAPNEVFGPDGVHPFPAQKLQ